MRNSIGCSRSAPACAVLVFLSVAPAISHAQQRAPEGWRWQLDEPATNVMGKDAPAGSWQFQEMIPGMHITSGPGVTLFLGGTEAAGRFMVDADLLLFPNSTTNGYGVMVGGRLGAGGDSTLHAWSALILSGSGQFAVVRHRAGKLEQLVPWTASDAIIRRDSVVITNRVRVWAERDSVRFVVNGKPIGALPRASVEPDGLFGLRLDEGINVHVTNVDLVRRLLKR